MTKDISEMLQIAPTNGLEPIQDTPNVDRKISKANFEEIKNKLERRLASWKARISLNVDKNVSIKPNLTGIPKFS